MPLEVEKVAESAGKPVDAGQSGALESVKLDVVNNLDASTPAERIGIIVNALCKLRL